MKTSRLRKGGALSGYTSTVQVQSLQPLKWANLLDTFNALSVG